MAAFIDLHFPAIFSSVDNGTTPSPSTFRIRSRSLHNFSLDTWNTARLLSHIRPTCWSKRVGTRSHLEILKKKPAHADRATARRRPAAAANHCSRGSFALAATGAHCYDSSIYVTPGIPRDRKNWLRTPETV